MSDRPVQCPTRGWTGVRTDLAGEDCPACGTTVGATHCPSATE